MAPRARKQHVQLDLLNKAGTKAKSKRGGKREKAGRKPTPGRPRQPHAKRPAFRRSVPLHVVLRVERVIKNLRRREIYKALRAASIVAARHETVRIVHISIQGTHIHLLVEAENRGALTMGMKSFQVSAAKQINRAIGRCRGRVFADRYHLELITSPQQARHALGYVLCNWRKHGEDEKDEEARFWLVDPYSTGMLFDGWKERDEVMRWRFDDPLVVREPRTWLLSTGWKTHGLISCHHVPKQRRKSR